MTRHIHGASLAILALFCGSPAQADHILNVTVPIGQYGSATAPGTYAATQSLKKIPGGADVVPARDFQNGYALSMKDMLATTPGVLAQPRWGEESRLSIRGSGLSRSFHLRGITLLQDGIPFTFADGSGDFQEIDPLILQHIEVYRGGNGLRYGAATLGGAVNMVTPTARTVDYNALLRAEGGSDKTVRLHAQAAKIFQDGDILAAATSAVSDGFRRQSAQDNQRFFTNAGINLGPNAETRFYLTWNDIDQEVPGTISKQAALTNPTSVPAINVTNDYARDIKSLRVANRTVFTLDNGMSVEAGFYMNDKTLYHPIFEVIDQKSVDIGGFGRLTGTSGRHEFVLGLNAGRGVNDAKRFVNVGGRRGVMTAYADQIAENLELYGEDTWYFAKDWSLIAGAQAKTAWRDYTDHLNHANDDEGTFTSLNPKLGVMYKLNPNSELFANLSRAAEVPTFSELVQGALPGFVPVDQQEAWTVEIGSRGRAGAFSWDVAAHHARVKDELLNFTVTPDIPASTFNAEDTIHQGLEIGLGWQATEELSFQGIYNLNDFYFEGDKQFGDNDLAGAPPHQIRLSAKYAKNGVSIEPNVEWIPSAAWVDYANTMKADSYALYGVKAGWDVNENVTLFAEGRNLTNEKTIASFSTITDARSAGTAVFYPGDGRSLFAGVKIKF